MSTEPPTKDDVNSDSESPLQFRIGHLLILMAVFGVASAVFGVAPDWVASATILVATNLAAAATTSFAIYNGGSVRAFCLGALFPIGLLVVTTTTIFVYITFEMFFGNEDLVGQLKEVSTGLRFAMCAVLLMAPGAGVMAVLIRRRPQS